MRFRDVPAGHLASAPRASVWTACACSTAFPSSDPQLLAGARVPGVAPARTRVQDDVVVDVRPRYWRDLDAGKIAELKAADLILFSPTAESGCYADGSKASPWNSLAVPLLQMDAFCTAQGEFDLTPASLQMLHNAIACLLPSGTGPQP